MPSNVRKEDAMSDDRERITADTFTPDAGAAMAVILYRTALQRATIQTANAMAMTELTLPIATPRRRSALTPRAFQVCHSRSISASGA
jgi:hypothetical protein